VKPKLNFIRGQEN